MSEYKVKDLKLEDYKRIKAGDTLLFGAYPQKTGEAPLPIEWEVLDEKDGKLLLLSTHGIDAMEYNSFSLDRGLRGNASWETCTLRARLNKTFFYHAFQQTERRLIAPVKLHNDAEPDRIFCLSYSEAVKYSKTRAVKFTDYAKDRGARPYFWNWSTEWWLRSTSDGSHAYYVSAEWGIQRDGVTWVTYAIRPALWLDPCGDHPSEPPSAEIPTAPAAEAQNQPVTFQTHDAAAEAQNQPVTFQTHDAAADAVMAPLSTNASTLRVGETLLFGSYEQGNGIAPIEWRVLDMLNGKALLITAKGIDCQPFHTSFTSVRWETSSIRTWLNQDFLHTAFTEGERARILPTVLDNGKHPQTTDKVFFFSQKELIQYFGGDIGDTRGHAAPTEYAMAAGAHKHKSGTCSWWLRTPSCSYPDNHAMIFLFTSALWGGDKVDDRHHAIRPVIWISLQ